MTARTVATFALRSAAVAALAALGAPALAAQQPGQGTALPPPTTMQRSRAATARDTAGRPGRRDTTGTRPLVRWASDSDSVATSLLNRPGYRATRYQGDTVLFNAATKQLDIQGLPAAVGREQTLIVGDSLVYNDSARTVVAVPLHGDSVLIHDPEQQASDIVARGRLRYNTATGRGVGAQIATSLAAGEQYYVSGAQTAFTRDTSRAGHSAFYVRNGIITSCDDSVPDYYFKSNEIKYVSRNLIVARPATLYVAGVPVFWLPFLFQDVRHGRRSGILTPRFGLSEFVRNSSSYRRHVENVGYYANLGDYMDAQAWLDWRSGARGTDGDPGYIKLNGEFRYRWLDRFMTGGLSASRQSERNGQRNTAVSWVHSQQFSSTSALNMDINFVTNTLVQRNTSLYANQVLSTIRSDVRYNRRIGQFSVDVGANREQYPGRTEILENYPSISVTSPSIAVTKWLDWTPTLNYQRQARVKTDEASTFFYRYFTSATGRADSVRVPGSTLNEALTFNTPVIIHGFSLTLSSNYSNQELNYPQPITFVNPADTSQRITRNYARSFVQSADFDFGFSLPTLLPNTLRVTPAVAFRNVYGGSYLVRTELSNGQWVHQSKRPTFSLGITPTLFGIFPGIGPFTSFRHSITPTLSYGYSPRGSVPLEYLRALNQNPASYIGNLASNSLTLGLNQVIEAKFRSDTGAAGEGRKVRLLAVDAQPLTFDFTRAGQIHRPGSTRGLTSNSWGYTLSSDLLPGFSFSSNYSLFQGDVQSDTARFKPFLTNINTNFSINGQSGIFAALHRLFGRPVERATPEMQNLQPTQQDALTDRLSSLPVAGSAARDRQYQIPETETWTTSISFSENRQRPPVGGRVVAFDPTTYCTQYSANPVIYDQCRQQALLNPQTTIPITSPIAGGVFVRVPPTETMNAQTTFHITDKWSANWGTIYDVVHHQFASQQVALQRDLHDWRALFSFSQAPNGNFYFSFFIANKAQPDLKFNYDKPTYRQQDLR